jgi:hypothetical protein
MYINEYFIILYDLTPDRAASEEHTSPVENGNIRIEFTFKEALKQAIMCLIPGIRQFCTCRFSANRHHRLLKNIDTIQLSCALKNVKSFLAAFTSDLLPYSISVPRAIIVNTDNHTHLGTHWLAIRLEPRSSTAFYFDFYSLSPDIPDIQSFLWRNCSPEL